MLGQTSPAGNRAPSSRVVGVSSTPPPSFNLRSPLSPRPFFRLTDLLAHCDRLLRCRETFSSLSLAKFWMPLSKLESSTATETWRASFESVVVSRPFVLPESSSFVSIQYTPAHQAFFLDSSSRPGNTLSGSTDLSSSVSTTPEIDSGRSSPTSMRRLSSSETWTWDPKPSKHVPRTLICCMQRENLAYLLLSFSQSELISLVEDESLPLPFPFSTESKHLNATPYLLGSFQNLLNLTIDFSLVSNALFGLLNSHPTLNCLSVVKYNGQPNPLLTSLIDSSLPNSPPRPAGRIVFDIKGQLDSSVISSRTLKSFSSLLDLVASFDADRIL